MRTFTKRTILLVTVMAMLLISSVCTVNASTVSYYKNGDVIELGTYPQSEVTDSSLISKLNSQTLNWISYGYYSGTGTNNGTMQSGDWMKYADVYYNGNKYRAVKFTQYRPYQTYLTSSASNSYQDENGYSTNTIYWFKYEPLKWIVLDADNGLVLSQTIIDAQAFNNYVNCDSSNNWWGDSEKTYGVNDWSKSSLRKWLNDSFYNTAFSTAQKTNITKATLNNSYDSQYTAVSTSDSVFLLSYEDVVNENYGFSSMGNEHSTTRRAKGSDYAKSQGLYCETSSTYRDSSYWRLRTLYATKDVCAVSYSGYVMTMTSTSLDYSGIRPAMKLDLSDKVDNTEDTYTLSYNANGGSGAPSPQNGAASYTISNVKPTRSGYTFLGWSKSSSATTASYVGGNSITLTANTTLYAVWQKNAVEPTPDVPAPTPAELPEIKINRTSTTAINYGDTLVLTFDEIEIPEGYAIEWYVEGAGVSTKVNEDGTECRVTSIASGNATITAKLVDENGKPVTNEDNEEIFDEIAITSKAGFWQKLVSFFKNLFGANRIIY